MSPAAPSAAASMGALVAFEGIDGAGKSTHVAAVAAALAAQGREVVTTREPGGTEGAEAIRALLLTGGADRWSGPCEALLFTAARRDHLERVIAPALERGAVVLCDRFVDSTRAYQAAGRGAPMEMVDALHRLAIGRDPDLTLIFDLDPQVAEGRRRPRAPDRIEAADAAFHARLRAAFRALAAETPDRRRLIDAAQPLEAVSAEAARLVLDHLAAARD